MKMLRNYAFAAAFALASFVGLATPPAFANNVVLCAPFAAGGANGSRQVTNPNTTTSYTLDGRGCGRFGTADVGYFQGLGYTGVGQLRSVITTGIANNFTAVIPAGAYISDIIFQELSGAAVTGGMFVGSAATTSDVVSTSVALSASGYGIATNAGTAKRVFSNTAPQTLYFGAFGATGNFNYAQVRATVVYGFF